MSKQSFKEQFKESQRGFFLALIGIIVGFITMVILSIIYLKEIPINSELGTCIIAMIISCMSLFIISFQLQTHAKLDNIKEKLGEK